MSEAPPDKPAEPTAEKKPEVAPSEPEKIASPEPAKEASAAPTTALADAAKGMDTAEKKVESAPIAAPATETAATAAAPAPTPPVTAPSAANTSGMHLQYVAPGVHRQSWFETNKYPVMFMAMAGTFALLWVGSRGGMGDLAGNTPSPVVDMESVGPTPNTSALPDQLPTDDSTYQPLANRMPAADLTVYAGPIGGPRPPKTALHGDAGVNKGGYADERADLDVAEAMIAKDPDKALALVDKHDKDYPRGILDPDARIIRIEAFQKKGDDAKTLALSDDFLQDYPHSPRVGVVQRIAEQIKNKSGSGGTNGAP
ncbi:MAG: hypothetical protein ACRELY_33130 [Polyangiaceae bacterium]